MNAQRPDEGSDVRDKSIAAQPSASSRQRLPRVRRITSSNDIRALFQQGKRSRTAHLDVFDSVSPFSYARTGLVVPKHRRNSVERNRLKRRLREVLRTEVLPRLRNKNVNADVLIRARREAYLATFSQLRDEIVAWVEKKW